MASEAEASVSFVPLRTNLIARVSAGRALFLPFGRACFCAARSLDRAGRQGARRRIDWLREDGKARERGRGKMRRYDLRGGGAR